MSAKQHKKKKKSHVRSGPTVSANSGGWWAGYMIPGDTSQTCLSGDQFGAGGGTDAGAGTAGDGGGAV